MCQNVPNQKQSPRKVDFRDQPVLVPSDIEYDIRGNKVGGVERLLHLRKIQPCGTPGNPVPVFKGTGRCRVFVAERSDRFMTDDIHSDIYKVP